MADAQREIDDHAGRIRKNKLLYEIYRDIYGRIVNEIPARDFPRLLELGSGGGFFREFAPHVITSECVPVSHVDRLVDACDLTASFEPSSLDAIAAFDVVHHLPNAAGFLRTASAVLRPGGRIVVAEPWFTPVGQWFWRAIHHEPYVMDPDDWGIRGEGRLGGANTRLPTSLFGDSDARFAREFPALRIVKRTPFHKWLYLFSGGLRLNTRVPHFIARRLVEADHVHTRTDALFGTWALVVVEKLSAS